jgi:hypothetical protein
MRYAAPAREWSAGGEALSKLGLFDKVKQVTCEEVASRRIAFPLLDGCADAVGSLHPSPTFTITVTASGRAMRAEIEKIVEDIKQSVGLLRRHL